jgi:hypothetical protein
VYNGHPWDLKKWPFDRGALIKVRFRLAIAELYWSLLTGGRCSEVVVKADLTVVKTPVLRNVAICIENDVRVHMMYNIICMYISFKII